MKLIFRTFFNKVLYVYFLITRSLTLGVRVLVFNSEGKLLLVEHTYSSGWHLPGGGVDIGESVESAAVRELMEETGICSNTCQLELVKVIHNRTRSRRDHVIAFRLKNAVDSFNTKSLEIKQVKYFDVDCLPSDVGVESRVAINMRQVY